MIGCDVFTQLILYQVERSHGSYVLRGNVYHRGVDPAEVLKLAQKAADAAPKRGSIHHTLGCALLRAGRYEDAIKTLQQAIELKKGEGTAWDWLVLAIAHHHLKQNGEARKYLDQSVAWMDRHLKGNEPIPGWSQPYRWPARVQLSLFRGEAEKLILGKPAAPKP